MSPLSRRSFALVALTAAVPRSARADLPTPESPTLKKIKETKIFRVAMSAGGAPFVLADGDADVLRTLTAPDPPPLAPTNDHRNVAGLDVDMATLVAASLGARLDITVVPRFDVVFEPLGRGEVDACFAGITRTVERSASLSFSSPYLVSGQEIMVREDARFPTLKSVQAAGVRIGAKRGTTSEAFAKQTLSQTELTSFDTGREVFDALDAGKLDGVVADGFIGRDAVVQKRVKSPLFSVERRRFTSESIAIAVRQADPDWTAYLSLVVHEAKVNGAFQKLAHRYNTWLRVERLVARNKRFARIGAAVHWAAETRERWEERLARNGRFFLLGLIIACTVEVVADWNSVLRDIDGLRQELRARAQNYASIIAKASIEPVLAYDSDGLDNLVVGLFDDEEVVFVRFADHQGTTVFDRLRPGFGERYEAENGVSFREHYAHQMTRDVSGILQDPELLAAHIAGSRHKDFIQAWTAFEDRVLDAITPQEKSKITNPRGVVLYQDRLKAIDGGHDGSLTYVLSTVVDERGEPWGVALVGFSLDKQNGVIRGKLLKGTGMLCFLVGLLLVQNVNGRREKIRNIEAKKRVSEAKKALADAMPPGELEAATFVVAGSVDQAADVVDGLIWDVHEHQGHIEICVVDPAGEGHAVASTALHVARVYREHRAEFSALGLTELAAELGRAAAMIPLGRPISPLIARIETQTGDVEILEAPVGSVRVVSKDGAVATPTLDAEVEAPDYVVGPLQTKKANLGVGARLVFGAAGIDPDGAVLDIDKLAAFVGRLHDAEAETVSQVAGDAATWARGKSPRLVDSDVLVAVIERRS